MDLLKDNLKKLYLRFLIPSLGSAMVMSIYTLTDAIVIGKGVGSDALAALSITTPLLCILMSMGMMMLPPVQISMPFKLMLFVLVDGWGLLTQQLFNSVLR